jgi:polysaccharide biosynthesis protein PslH
LKILVITTKSPYPLNEGRALRTYNLIKEMARQHELHLVSFVQDAIDVAGIEHMRSICPVVEAIPLYLGRVGKLKLLPDVLREPFGPRPLPVVKYMHAGMRRAIERLRRAHRYDLVHLDMLHLAGYMQWLQDVPVLLMEHNLEAQILSRRADLEQQPLKKAYLAYQERKLRAFERQACREATTVVAVSDIDAQQIDALSGRTDTVCVPNGVDTQYFRSARPALKPPPQGHTLVYVGGFTWFPNLDAIDYFHREILPIVRAEVPDVKLKVIGRYVPNAQSRDIAADPAIELCGMVDDIRPTIDAAAIYIVPLRIGGGTM